MNLNFISLYLSARLNDLLDWGQNACWIKLKYSNVSSSLLNKQPLNKYHKITFPEKSCVTEELLRCCISNLSNVQYLHYSYKCNAVVIREAFQFYPHVILGLVL